MKKDLNKPCGHNCYRLREYTCTACAESEKEQMLIQIGKYEERILILEKLIIGLIDINQQLLFKR